MGRPGSWPIQLQVPAPPVQKTTCVPDGSSIGVATGHGHVDRATGPRANFRCQVGESVLAYFDFFLCQSGFLGRGLRTDAMFALTFAQQSLLSCGLRPYLARRPNCAKDCRGAESWQWLRLPLLRL